MTIWKFILRNASLWSGLLLLGFIAGLWRPMAIFAGPVLGVLGLVLEVRKMTRGAPAGMGVRLRVVFSSIVLLMWAAVCFAVVYRIFFQKPVYG